MAKEENILDNRLKTLLDFAKSVDLEELAWEKDGVKVAFKRSSSSGAPAGDPSSEEEAGKKETRILNHYITSPMVGTFKLSAGKGRPPLVVEGGGVSPGQKVGIVEAMNIPKDVVSGVDGHINRILVNDGKPVEYGQPLFEVIPVKKPGD